MGKKEKIERNIVKEETGQHRKESAVLLRAEQGRVRQVPFDDWVKVDRDVKSEDWIIQGSYAQFTVIDPFGSTRSGYNLSAYWPLGSFMSGTPHHSQLPNGFVALTLGALDTATLVQPVAKAIEEAQPITDWDDNGALPIGHETWRKAIGLLMEYAGYIAEHYSLSLTAPQIDAVPDGSIDLFWKEPKAQLLINVKPEAGVATYYGDTYSEDDKIKGKIPLEGIKEYLAVWMKNLSR
jgi:hypothetical protein